MERDGLKRNTCGTQGNEGPTQRQATNEGQTKGGQMKGG